MFSLVLNSITYLIRVESLQSGYEPKNILTLKSKLSVSFPSKYLFLTSINKGSFRKAFIRISVSLILAIRLVSAKSFFFFIIFSFLLE